MIRYAYVLCVHMCASCIVVCHICIYLYIQITNFAPNMSQVYILQMCQHHFLLPGICAVSSASNQFFSQTTDVQRGSPGEGFSAAKNETLDGWLVISLNPEDVI